MDEPRPENEHGPSPSTGARIEEDLVRPLKRIVGSSRLRLPAVLPFALAGILVVSSVAFGAAFVRTIITASPNATPVVYGDDPVETPTPTPEVTPTPTPTPAEATPTPEPIVTPVPGDLALTAEVQPGKV